MAEYVTESKVSFARDATEEAAKRSAGPQAQIWAAFILGFALGGFFDGILLHQVLQWHHFLSLVGGQSLREIRTQIVADGLFHVAVYLVMGVGLWMLWRSRLDSSSSDRRFFGALLLGFGIWQFADVLVFHWIIQIHHIRVDVPNPVLWDVGWLIIIGLPPTAIGWFLLRSIGPEGGSGRFGARPGVAAVVIIAYFVSAYPLSGQKFTTVLLRPGLGANSALELAAAVDARLVWADSSGELAVLQADENISPLDLYSYGAMFVSNAMIGSGCLGWETSSGPLEITS